MASSSSNTNQNNQRVTNEITQEELFAFHNVDRQFFMRLVFNLRRDPSQAIQSSAFWLWLERLNRVHYVATIIKYSDPVFEALFEETLLCLRVTESEELEPHGNLDVPLVRTIVGVHNEGLNLRFFHEYRIQVILGINSIIQHICLRAFQDLIQIIVAYNKRASDTQINTNNNVNNVSLPLLYRSSVGVIGDGSSRRISSSSPCVGVIGDRRNSHATRRSRPSVGVIGDGRRSRVESSSSTIGVISPNNVGAQFLGTNVISDGFVGRGNPSVGVIGDRIDRQISVASPNVCAYYWGTNLIGDGLGRQILENSPSVSVISDYFDHQISSASQNVGVFGGKISCTISPNVGVIGDSFGGHVISGEGSSSGVGEIGDGFIVQMLDGSRRTPIRSNQAMLPQCTLTSLCEQNVMDENKGVLDYYPHLKVGDFNVPLRGYHHNVSNTNFLQGGGVGSSNSIHAPLVNVSGNKIESQPEILQGHLVDQLLAQMCKDDERDVPPSERTIFLTFSKGYPIHEIELREFFNRTFGDIIEALYMQEVGTSEQPLYARLVVRDTNAMAAILSDRGKSKFSINGRHVWARKFVRKTNFNSPPTSPSTN